MISGTGIDASRVTPIWKELKTDASAKAPNRVADIDFKISDSDMVYTHDLKLFSDNVNKVFTWHEDKEVRQKYMAPYFPVVQSSGMGKTKLLYEYKQYLKNSISDITAILILCKSKLSSGIPNTDENKYEQDKIFDYSFVPETTSASGREEIIKKLNKIVSSTKSSKVVLCFDESQTLIKEDAFSFRCIRWWLRSIMDKQIVGVFTGTTSKLANFYLEQRTTEYSRGSGGYYEEDGHDLYEPFFMLSTTGIMATYDSNTTDNETDGNFAPGSQYGRPLFGLMDFSNDEGSERYYQICRRMLLQSGENLWSDESYFSLLGSRVQFGQTNMRIASELVSSAYALLIHFDYKSNIAFINFPPEPVCARIAMSLMVEGYQIRSNLSLKTYTGKEPKEIMHKAEELYSKGIAFPPKGDIGEIACALYMLFCGDVLRYSLDPTLLKFGVPFPEWVSILKAPVKDINSSGKEALNSKLVINFIQVCQNSLRYQNVFLNDQHVLSDWFNAGLAFYGPSQNFAYDILAPIQVIHDKQGQLIASFL